MHDLIRKVSRNVGIGEDKAKTAVETVLAHLRSRMPVSVSHHLENALEEDGPSQIAGRTRLGWAGLRKVA